MDKLPNLSPCKKFTNIIPSLFTLWLLLFGCKDLASDTIEDIVANPIFSPGTGTFNSAQYVTILSNTIGAIILYTIDGSVPSQTNGIAVLNGDSVLISTTTTLRAIARLPGWKNSEVVSAIYTITGSVATPVFTPTGGSYSAPQNVVVSCSTPGASIRYTTDGTTPNHSYGTIVVIAQPVLIASSTTLRALAYKADWDDSQVVSATYIIRTWEELPGPSSAAVQGLAFHPDGLVFAVSNNIVFRSSNSGNSWDATYNPPTGYRLKAVVANRRGDIFIGAERDTAGPHFFESYVMVLRSVDRGVAWNMIYQSAPGPRDFGGIAIDSTGTILVGSGGPGLSYSTNNGGSWSDVSGIWTFDVAISEHGIWFAATPFQGLMRSSDSGATWSASPGFPSSNIVNKIETTLNSTIYAVVNSHSVHRSMDGGNTSIQVLSGIDPTAFGKSPAGATYVGTTNDLYLTTDNGTSWHTQALPGVTVSSIAIAADGLELVGASTGLVYRSAGQ